LKAKVISVQKSKVSQFFINEIDIMRLLVFLFLLLSISGLAQNSGIAEQQKDCNLPPRTAFEIIEFKGQYFFMGGEKPNNPRIKEYYNDIWTSYDGENWTLVKSNAPWVERANFNLLEFENHLWIIGGENDNLSEFINDVWKSADGVNWTRVLAKGPWPTRSLMSVSKHNDKLYLIGGQSTTNWHLYQDIWETGDGLNWKKVGSISDELLGVDQSREGIHEHTITELNGVYYLMCGLIASTFSRLERVLKSTDMIHWELATKETPWNEFDYLKLNNIRPVAYNTN
jgi:hypothetical protein